MIFRPLRVANALSIDVALGAVCSSYLFYRALNISPKWEDNLVLALTVWLIYTADHLIDGRKINGPASTFRHRLHQKYYKTITSIFILLLVLNVYLSISTLESNVFQNGLILFILVGIHHLICHLTKVDLFIPTKELRIAILYSCGLALVPYSNSHSLDLGFYLLLASITCIAYLNLILFAEIEKESDERDKFQSIGRIIGDKKMNFIFWIFTFLSTLLISAFFIFQAQNASNLASLLSLMLVILLSIHLFKTYFHSWDLYRIFGDGIFVFPVILPLI